MLIVRTPHSLNPFQDSVDLHDVLAHAVAEGFHLRQDFPAGVRIEVAVNNLHPLNQPIDGSELITLPLRLLRLARRFDAANVVS